MTLSGQLLELEASGLIRVAQLEPEVEYRFGHALIQEAAYQSLVKMDRRRVHLAVGEALERLYPAELASPDLTPQLARHFAEAGEAQRALHFYRLAGQAATEAYANAEAVEYFTQALGHATALGAGGQTVTELYLQRGRALELNAQDAEALANYSALEAWAAADGDKRAQLAGLAARAAIYVKPTVIRNQALGYELSHQALALARELSDRPAEAKALWNLLQYYLAESEMDGAIACGQQALAIAREHGLREQSAFVLTDLIKAYFQGGQHEQARAALREAQSLWRELGRRNMLADNLATTSLMHIIAGDYEQALAHSAEAQQLSRAIGSLWNQAYAGFMIDLVHFDRGDLGRALAVAQDCLRLAEQAGFAEGRDQAVFDLALMYIYLNALPRALEAIQRVRRQSETPTGLRPWPLLDGLLALLHLRAGRLAEAQATMAAAEIPEDEADLRQWFYTSHVLAVLIRGELALAEGRPQRVIALMGGLLPFLRQNGMRLFLADVLYLQGQALRADGQVDSAEAVLAEARATAEAIGARRVLWQVLAELASLAAERGDAATARALHGQAAGLLADIAAHIGSPELAEAFLSRPDVRRTLAQSGRAAQAP